MKVAASSVALPTRAAPFCGLRSAVTSLTLINYAALACMEGRQFLRQVRILTEMVPDEAGVQ